jgi:hypothetical protein
MAAVAKSGTPSLSTLVPGPEHQISGLTAGEALAAFDACVITDAGGVATVVRSTGAAATAAAIVHGYAAQAYVNGAQNVTLYWNVDVRYGAGLTPGASLFLGADGALDDAATTGGTAPCGHVIDATRVHLMKSVLY